MTDREDNSRLEGLRGWLAALDRMVGVRTRVGLVLLAIAIGAAAAAAYLAIDTREDSASEAQLRELQGQLERRLDVSQQRASAAEAEVARLRAEVEELGRREPPLPAAGDSAQPGNGGDQTP
jgi:hypothetical protein